MKIEQFNVKLIHCGNRNITNAEDNLEKSVFFMPMGIFALAKILKENGFNGEIIHLDLEMDKDIEEILEFNSLDAVGFDCHWANQSLTVINTAEIIKKMKPGPFVFLGGFTASFFAKEILEEHPYIDAIIRGDAEVPLLELCRALQAKKMAGHKPGNTGDTSNSFENIPNLVWKENNGEVRFNEFSYVASSRDMGQLDFAEMTLLRNWELYRDSNTFFSKYNSLNSPPQFLLSVGRGCVYGCSFCGGNHKAQMSINNRKGQIVRSIDSVMSDIKKAVSFGFRLFMVDFNFENYEEYFTKLFQRIKKDRLDIIFGFGCWRIPSKSLIDTISECFPEAVIQISPETGDHDLRKINKDIRLFYTNREIEECLEYIESKKNLKVQFYFGYFLPFDTEETIFITLEYMEKIMLKYSHFAELYYGNLSTDPASLLFLYPDKYDIDINLRSFSDYLTLLKQNFQLKKGGAPDITAFKPRNLSNKTVASLTGKIRLFNDLILCFETSIILLSEKMGKRNVISRYLREVEIPVTGKSNFELDEIKGILLNICKEYNVLDHELITAIGKEYKAAKLPSASKLRQFYSYKSYNRDLSMEEGYNQDPTHLEKEENKRNPGKIKFQEEATNFDFE